jgi:poly(A) polymerase
VAESGRILRDNVWGTHAEDAARRDFTINAMYYDPASETVLDYHGGMADIRSKTIRMIGNPIKRYREDPIRMLRAIRFAAKTNFQIESETRKPIAELGDLIHDVPSARLFDEILKLLMSGHAWAGIQALHDAGLHHGLLPLIDKALANDQSAQFIQRALRNTDERIQAGKSVSPGFLFASLLWPDLEQRWQGLVAGGMPNLPAMHAAIDDTIAQQNTGISVQRRHEGDMRDIWTMQPRFEKRNGRYPYRLLEVPRFRAGYDFMLLRSQVGSCHASLGQWWTDFIHADLSERENLIARAKDDGLPSTQTPASPNKRRRHRSKRSNSGAETTLDFEINGGKQN